MQFLKITKNTTLEDIESYVGSSNIDYTLHINNIPRVPNVGEVYINQCEELIDSIEEDVSWQRKYTLLNSFTSDYDLFEKASLSNEYEWRVISETGAFIDAIKIPSTLQLKSSEEILGDKSKTPNRIYSSAMSMLESEGHYIDPVIFNEYTNVASVGIASSSSSYAATNSSIIRSSTSTLSGSSSLFQYFKIPWGDVTLYSSLSEESVDFPVYPESVSDSVKANYTQMPELLYQYEPWQIYTSSGPRSNSYSFDFHRDMWTGDHRDGCANTLIRFCMANCYPEYNGSAVNTSTVTLYIKGSNLITGIVTDVSVDWDGPIGLDGWYLHCKLTISITEVSKSTLSYESVKNKYLIG